MLCDMRILFVDVRRRFLGIYHTYTALSGHNLSTLASVCLPLALGLGLGLGLQACVFCIRWREEAGRQAEAEDHSTTLSSCSLPSSSFLVIGRFSCCARVYARVCTHNTNTHTRVVAQGKDCWVGLGVLSTLPSAGRVASRAT